MNRARHLFRSSLIVIALFGLGKITGLIRIRLVASEFGATMTYDAFTAANQLPEVFFTLIAGGALAAAFIPVYSNYLTSEPAKKAAALANTILTLVLLILGAICLVTAVFAPWITAVLLVPDFSPEQQALTAQIMRIILIQTILFGVSGVLSSILNAHQHFALPALAPLALDVGYIMGLYLLVPELGIVGLAWGTVIGAVLHILVQTPALIKYKFRYRPTLAVQLSGVREIVRLMGPRLVTLGAIQIADLFIIRLASGLAEGSTSGYFYGYALMQFPETLFGTAIAIVMFPTMAELFNSGQIEQMKHTAVSALRIIWFLTIPTAALLVLLGQPVITVLLQGNAFDADATQLVYSVLLVFSIRLVSEATVEIVARLLYAQHNTRTPMFAYLIWLAVNVSLAYLWVERWGVVGLAAASTVAFTVLAGLLYWLNGRKLGALGGRELSATAVRALIATVVMTAVILLLQTLELSTLPFLVIAGSAGAATYLLLYTLLGGQEIFTLLRLIKQ